MRIYLTPSLKLKNKKKEGEDKESKREYKKLDNLGESKKDS